jgi:hypothetical protein
MKVRIEGLVKSKRADKETGEVSMSTQIYYTHVRELTPSVNSIVSGVKTGEIWTRLNVGNMCVGELYDFEIELREFQGKSNKILVDFTPAE